MLAVRPGFSASQISRILTSRRWCHRPSRVRPQRRARSSVESPAQVDTHQLALRSVHALPQANSHALTRLEPPFCVQQSIQLVVVRPWKQRLPRARWTRASDGPRYLIRSVANTRPASSPGRLRIVAPTQGQ